MFLLVLALLVQVSPTVANGLAAASRPFLEGLDAIGNVIGRGSRLMPLSGKTRQDLRKLEQENAELRLRAQRQQVFLTQNKGLREALNLELAPEWEVHRASIIARDPVTWERGFRIGKGSADGIKLGAAVLEREHVIGRVVSLSAHSATVATLPDRDGCRISVMLEDSGVVGILQGATGERRERKPVCRITYLPRENEYVAGDLVVTSGLSDVIPEGLPVGRTAIWDNRRDADMSAGTHARVKFVPLASFEHFRFVTVVSVDPDRAEP